MKLKLVKSTLCLLLAGTLALGEAGTVLAAEAGTTKAVTEETTEVPETADAKTAGISGYIAEIGRGVSSVKTTNKTPSISSLSTSLSSSMYDDRDISVNFNGYGSEFKIYVNNVLWATIENYQDTYDSETGEWVQLSAPYGYGYSNFDQVLMGGSYTIKVVPYNKEGKAGTAKSSTVKTTIPTVYSASAYTNVRMYNANGYANGFYVSINANADGNANKWEIYRAEGKKTAKYSLIGTSSGGSGLYFSDSNVKVGKKYYYKIRTASGTNEYLTKNVNGSWSEIQEVVIGKPEANCSVSYDNGAVSVSCSADYASGYEIYRSTKKGSGYKKIATITDTEYVDTTIKSGSTYYYKVKGFYYDIESGKKYAGALSEAAGVKVIMGYIDLEVKQTGKNNAKLEWNPVAGAANYEIYYKSDMEGDAYRFLGSTTKTNFTAKKLSADTYYYFQIRAYKEAGNVKNYYQSSSDGVYMGFKAPQNVTVTKKTVSVKGTTATITTTLKWDRVYGATGYKIQAYDSASGKTKVLKTIKKASTTSYKLKNTITPTGAKYGSVYVVAYKGNEQMSSYVGDITSTLNTVTNVKAKRKTASSAVISWKKSAGANSYMVYRKSPNASLWAYVGTTTKTNIIDNNITPGVTYTYIVQARNTNVNISDGAYYYYSNVGDPNVTTYNHKLGATSISSVKNSASKKATITWKASPYGKQYMVYRSTKKNGTYKKIATVKGKTTYTDSKLTKGKTYYYKVVVKTVNDAGITMTSEMSAAKSVKIKK